MKKIVLVLCVVLITGGALFAQAVPWGPTAYNQTDLTSVKVNGKLALINGIIGLKQGGKTYYVPMLGRLSGFIDSVKEGAYVKLEGYEYPYAAAPEYVTLMVTKLTVGGKDYDLSQFAGYGMGYGGHGRMMGGRHW